MKPLLRTTLILILFFPLMSGVSTATDKIPTLKEQMKVIHDIFDVNFIYDSSLDLDIPYKGQPMTGESLESCLEALFKDTGINYEINRKYIVLTKTDSKKKPSDYTIFIEEQRDTLSESIITALIAKDLNTTQTGFRKIGRKTFDPGFAVMSSPDIIKSIHAEALPLHSA